ncbi:MAG: HAMP domain-containing histidine kinase [Oscillospiraceae bacterium]|nr:HAMP domain-containing histidine kinase [Oscillospiraceae bacterium]
MKYSKAVKAISILLAACTLVITVVSGVAILALAGQGLYETDYNTWREQFYKAHSERMARAAAESFAARTEGNLSPYELKAIGWGNSHQELSNMWNMAPDSWGYQIRNTNDGILETVLTVDLSAEYSEYYYALRPNYPVRVLESADWSEHVDYWLDGKRQDMFLDYRRGPEYLVEVWMTADALETFSGIDLELYEMLWNLRWIFVILASVGLLVFAICIIWLCYIAGKSPDKDTVEPGGLNKLPLDLYGGLLGAAAFFLSLGVLELLEDILFFDRSNLLLGVILSGAGMFGASLCVVAFLFAFAAQVKQGFRKLWERCLIGWCFVKLWELCKWVWKVLCKLYSLLPIIWRYLLIAFAMVFFPLFFFCGCYESSGSYWFVLLILSLLADVAMVCYGAFAYGTLLKGVRRMAEGDLHTGISTKYLRGGYQTCAEDLNTIADVAVVAAKKQMRSERMKTELITNVSHDIKTPLTSVINYIDLLQNAETTEQRKQYLEVLARQAQKLKKLVEDLMEMSKASTGDMPVELTTLDGAEAVNQALGEFADKLAARQLQVILQLPGEPVPVLADGQLTWRVLSNLMGNIVKYALPGTRVYVSLTRQENGVQLSLKNISESPLNISADELTERFVRGDVSRNTEGSGLGLHIAKSLMELQKGSLELQIDGDLFKVTLTFVTEN